jgi:hypothetical protein
MFVCWSDHFVNQIDHPQVSYGNLVNAPIDFFQQAFILVGQAEIV